MEALLTELKSLGLNIGLNIVYALLIVIIGFRLVKWIEKLLKNGKAFKKLEQNVKSFLISFISIALKALILICAATTLGIPMTSIITLVGSFALAIGLALQGGLSNIAGGLMILIFKPFRSGDYIEAGSKEGKVTAVNLFYTVLTTIDNKKIMLPNGDLTNTAITNYTALSKRRLDLNFEVSYDSDIEKVKKVLLSVMKKEKAFLKDEELFARMTSHNSSSLTFTTRAWVKQDDYWTTRFNMLENVKKEFDKNDIEIPYDQVDVHMKK